MSEGAARVHELLPNYPLTRAPMKSLSGVQKSCLLPTSRDNPRLITYGSSPHLGTWQNLFLLTRQRSGMGRMEAGRREFSACTVAHFR